MSAPTAAPALTQRRIRLLPENASWLLYAGLALAVVVAFVAVFAPLLQTHDPDSSLLSDRLLSPGENGHLLGTDQLGRDLLSRTIAGFRWSLGIGFVATMISSSVGALAGILAAMRPGIVRTFLTRVVDVTIAFPSLVIAVTIIAVVGRGFWALALTLGLVSWPIFARVVYAESLGLMEREYLLAARLLGVSWPRILLTHMLPGLRPTLMVMWAFTFADLLIAESALSFLGLGAPLGAPSWGNMLSEAREYLTTDVSMLLVPGAAIVLAVVTANLVGDGIAASARLRRRSTEVA